MSNKTALAFELLVLCVWNCLVGCWWGWLWWWQGGDKCSSHSIATVQTLNNNLDTTMTFSPFKCWVTFTSRKYIQTNKSIWMCYARQCHCQSHEWGGQQGHIRFWSTHHSLLIESHPPLFVWKSSHYWIIKESSDPHNNTKSQSQYFQNNSCAPIKDILLT